MKKIITALTTLALSIVIFSNGLNAFAKTEEHIHTVVEGDTLYKLSKIYDCEISAIQEANGLSEDDFSIQLGKNLIIPVSGKSDTDKVPTQTTAVTTITTAITSTETITSTTTTEKNSENAPNNYVVKSGDTLGAIARKYNVIIENLLKWNPKIKNPNMIIAGQTININAQAKEENSNTDSNDNSYYIVKSGDTLSKIAEKYNTSLKYLLKLNPKIINSHYIYVGQKIFVGVYTENTQTIAPTVPSQTNTLPDEILSVVNEQKEKYPGMKIGIGIYKGNTSYVYNHNSYISGGCTVKAAYAMYVLTECEKRDIDIYNTYLTYEEGMKNNGSGTIKNSEYGSEYTIDYLVSKLLVISDNTAYNILCSEFSIRDFQTFLNKMDGQQLWGTKYGSTTVQNRANEWFAIIDYVQSDSKYSQVLYHYLDIAQYGYIEQGMSKNHKVLHKSGWCDGTSYTCACDCAYVDDEYLVVIMTQDYSTGKAHADVLRALGGAVEDYFG